jgi:hypothetical protein
MARSSKGETMSSEPQASKVNGAEPVPETPKAKNLMQKIAEISAAIKSIKMTGTNTHDGYKYLKIEDAVNAARPLMQAQGLVLTPQLVRFETVPDTKGIMYQVTLNWTLEDIETGEQKNWMVPGTGWDYHDKGLYKAITGSRKYAHIIIFNLPIGDNPEQSGAADRETAKASAQTLAQKKIADAAGKGNKTAIEALSQVEPEKKILISRPEEHNGFYIVVSGYIAVPPLERFFDDTDSKRFKSKKDLVPYWRVPSEYEKGLLALCEKLGIEVEG